MIHEVCKKSLSELRHYVLNLNRPIPAQLLELLGQDPRAGARRLAHVLRQKKLKSEREEQRLNNILRFETELRERGFCRIAGVDEAGMAPLAGPVVAAAVILPSNYRLAGLDDSKKILSDEKRQKLATAIKRDSICWAVGRAEVEEIDRINIYQSGLLAMHRAVSALETQPDFLLVDARTIPRCACPQRGIIHGDALSASIAAASILAKTTRDNQMKELDRIYAGYGFASHKGYPTPEHLKMLKERGALPIHRKSFGPVREILSSQPYQGGLF